MHGCNQKCTVICSSALQRRTAVLIQEMTHLLLILKLFAYGAHTLTRMNLYDYICVNSYQSKRAETAWCKLNWLEIIRVIGIYL